MSSMEISQNVGTPPENLANDEDHLTGSKVTKDSLLSARHDLEHQKNV